MASKFTFVLILFLSSRVESATLIERSYEYVMNIGKSLAPSFLTILDCFGGNDPWNCAKDKAGKMLDGWDAEVDKQRSMWQSAADSEISSSGRSLDEMPSKLGWEVEQSLVSLVELMQQGMERASTGRKHGGGGIDAITISTGGGDKKKKMKKKKKPANLHLHHAPMMMDMMKQPDDARAFSGIQSWVIGDPKAWNEPKHLDQTHDLKPKTKTHEFDNEQEKLHEFENVHDDVNVMTFRKGRQGNVREGRGIVGELWQMGEKAIDAMAEHAVKSDNIENDLEDKSSSTEQRGKKKKKKKAILKLLILGAVLKAKIGTLLQILSFKLQVKFFLIALIGLAINLARFWLDVKKSHHHQPQKVIYFEHAQHQHHYDHEEDHEPGWGPWSRSMDPPEETDAEIDVDFHNNPYRAQIERNSQLQSRPAFVRV